MSITDNKEYQPKKDDRMLWSVLGGMAGCFGGGCLLLFVGLVMRGLDMHDAADSIFLNPAAMGFVGAAAGGSVMGVWLGGKHAAYNRMVISNVMKGADQPDK